MSQRSPGTPSLGEALEQIFQDRLEGLRAIEPAEAEWFDRVRQTATVRPVTLGRGASARPVAHMVPVIFPVAYYDIQAGTTGVLLMADQDWRAWWQSGEDSEPRTRITHDLANSVFLPGLRPSTNPHASLPADASVLERPSAGGTVRLGHPSATKAAVHEDLLSDLDTFLGLLDTWAAAVGVPAGVPWAGQPVQAALQNLRAGISLGSYKSPSVKVED